MSVAALLLTRGSLAASLSVVAGGLLMAVSYVTLKSSATSLVSVLSARSTANGAPRRREIAWIALKMTGRYALLAVLAYVMIARLRLHPLGLLAGVSSVVAAASIEAISLLMQKKPNA